MNIQIISYGICAPISAVCQVILIFGYMKVKKMKKHPEIMIFWQCVSQIILDVHWISGLSKLHNQLPEEYCQLLGSFFVYFYYLSWNYVLFLSIEIVKKISDPLKCNYTKRLIIYHSISHLSSLSVSVLLATVQNNNGQSLIKTCFVQRESVYELFILLPVFVHFPICLYICSWVLCYSLTNDYIALFRHHVFVVTAFSISWVPIALAHGLDYSRFSLDSQTILDDVSNI